MLDAVSKIRYIETDLTINYTVRDACCVKFALFQIFLFGGYRAFIRVLSEDM
jgi:hypothetical protein